MEENSVRKRKTPDTPLDAEGGFNLLYLYPHSLSSLTSSSTLPQDEQNHQPPQPVSSENDTINPPYPWATNRRATVHSLEYLRQNNINKVAGELQCMNCGAKRNHEFDLEEKIKKVAEFVSVNRESMRELAPELGPCDQCGATMKPVIPESKEEEINWLFLLLGQMLGFCSKLQLSYFCKCNNNHHKGGKPRLLLLTYLALCKQLDPTGPFDL